MSSQKITSKNLSYDDSLPPFLARLHAQAAGGADSPDPILAARRRARGPGRSASEEAEDAPLVLDEHGNAVSLRVDDDGAIVADKGSTATEEPAQGEADSEGGEKKAKKPDTMGGATFGSSGRKRKAGKVVGEDHEGDRGAANDTRGKSADTRGASATSTSTKEESAKANGSPGDPQAKAKPKKKVKKIKLSFDDD